MTIARTDRPPLRTLADPRLQFPDQSFQGLIFDCDGTLVDSMPLHHLAWIESLRRHEAPFDFSEEIFYSCAGVREQDVVMALNQQHGCAIDPDSVAKVKQQIFFETLPQLQPIEPVAALARAAAEHYPLSVASGSEEDTVLACLEATGLSPYFNIIITPAKVRQGKPAPDMFLLAAEQMGVNAADCLVFEDGNSGLQAAAAANMAACFIPRDLR